jgi:hypothetical protein
VKTKILSILVPALFVVSCNIKKKENTEQTTAETKTTTELVPAAPAFDVKDANSLVGQKLEVVQPALEAAEISFRIIEKDGESMIMTMDYRSERLNFKTRDGVIFEVSKG